MQANDQAFQELITAIIPAIFTHAEAARILDVSTPTIHRWLNQETTPHPFVQPELLRNLIKAADKKIFNEHLDQLFNTERYKDSELSLILLQHFMELRSLFDTICTLIVFSFVLADDDNHTELKALVDKHAYLKLCTLHSVTDKVASGISIHLKD